jgi:hypothetical protein
MSPEADILLFSYGTLQLPQVQIANYGRRLDGSPDALVGWTLMPLTISDPDVIRLSGLAVHTIARQTGRATDRIEGMVYAITRDELEATDRYEVDAYGRICVQLESGRQAFVYVGPGKGLE